MMWSELGLIFWILVQTSRFCFTADEGQYMGFCRSDLGMYSGALPDKALSASSSYDEKSVGPFNSRIRQEKNGGAWCPKKPTTKELEEWLQIDLPEIKVISLVETQGRFGNGQGQEFAPHYALDYQRLDDGRWIRYRDKRGTELMKGNTNTYIAELRELRPPIVAKRIRFLPWSSHPRTTCLRVELYGCPSTDGVLSYSMRQGDKRGPDIDLYDETYDGEIIDGYLTGGLGQLTDFEEGGTNFRLDQHGVGKRGFEWVGWKNDSNSTQPLEIVFHFDGVRNISLVRIHVNNLIAKEVSVFHKLLIFFSVDGRFYGDDALVFEYTKDLMVETARSIPIPIPHRIGRLVKLAFFFDARWLLISEVRFVTELLKNAERALAKLNSVSVNSSSLDAEYEEDEDEDADAEEGAMRQNSRGGYQMSVTILDSSQANASVLLSVAEDGASDPRTRQRKQFDETDVGIIVGAAFGSLLVVATALILLLLRYRKKLRYRENTLAFKSALCAEHRNLPVQLASLASNSKTSNGLIYQSVSTNDIVRTTEKKNLHVVELCDKIYQQFDEVTGLPLGQAAVYEVPLNLQVSTQSCAELPLISLKPNTVEPLLAVLPASLRQSTLESTLDEKGHQGPTTFGTFSATSSANFSWKEEVTIPEILWEDLVFVEKLGEGLFGEVHLCQLTERKGPEAEALDDQKHLMTTDDQAIESSRSSLVAVKVLRKNPTEQDWLDFQKEMKILSHLNDPNILRLFGKCTKNDTFAVVLEYMVHGDLFQFLRDSVLENCVSASIGKRCLSYGSLIYMSMQIASGMKYLESLDLVHRDLATRNCLVGQKYTIKIADFGMSRSIYSNDYYDCEGSNMLPIRWMAWESILLGRFSCKSDVWSFGVMLWEILELARDRPFSSFTNDEIIENCEHIRVGNGLEKFLPQPAICPKEIYDLMMQCWSREEAQRPTFREIHMFLQRRNIGYDSEKVEIAKFKRTR